MLLSAQMRSYICMNAVPFEWYAGFICHEVSSLTSEERSFMFAKCRFLFAKCCFSVANCRFLILRQSLF